MAKLKSDESHSTNDAQKQREMPRGLNSRTEPSKNREQNLDQTIADSFPASDPPSSDPNPEGGS